MMRDFSRSLPMALMRAREATMRTFRPMLAEHDLTEQQWRVLRALHDAEAGLDVSEIAGRTFLLGPSLSRILANLERREIVHRGAVDHDGRRARITISDRGRQLVDAVAPRTEYSYAWIENQFGTDRLEQLLRSPRRAVYCRPSAKRPHPRHERTRGDHFVSKAIQIKTTGGTDVMKLVSREQPAPEPAQVLVEVEAAGVNFIDTYHRSGLYELPMPYVLGQEGGGTITAVGSAVTTHAAGQRVVWTATSGSYAEHHVVPVDALVTVPDGVDIEIATAAMLQGMTAPLSRHRLPSASGWRLVP